VTGQRPVIDLDHNATAPLRPEVAALLTERLAHDASLFGNASSTHRRGREARKRLDAARAKVAELLGCEPREVCFTASGSEANALALKGAFFASQSPKPIRIVASRIEHPAVLSTLEQLAKHGAALTWVPPEPSGQVDAEVFIRALEPTPSLAVLMWANNETGVLQPVDAVSAACRDRGLPLLIDAVQAAGKVAVDARKADLMSFAGHKLGSPPGIGVLRVRRGLPLSPLVSGHQEFGLRGGTANVAYAEAFALALELAVAEQAAATERQAKLRDDFERALLEGAPGATVNGAAAPRLANTSNVRFPGLDGEALLIALDLEGIHASSGAACASGTLRPSHVLTAMGLSPKDAQSSLRFSLGRSTTQAELQQAAQAVTRLAPRCRIQER
jgi:cysteine desulfurase